MPAWPVSLPQRPLANSFQEQAPDLLLRSQMDQGPDKTRQRYTAGVRNMQMQMTLTAAQVETLDNFFINDLSGGAAKFDWVHPRTAAAETFRFTEPPNYSQLTKGAYSVSLNLEILP